MSRLSAAFVPKRRCSDILVAFAISALVSLWAGFPTRHLDTHDAADATAGLARAGWRLVYRPTPSETFRQDEEGDANLTYSIRASVDESGKLRGVRWDGPAFPAALTPGSRIVSVNSEPFALPILLQAVADTPTRALQLEIAANGRKRSVLIAYSGARYPWLERIEGTPDRLTPLLTAR